MLQRPGAPDDGGTGAITNIVRWTDDFLVGSSYCTYTAYAFGREKKIHNQKPQMRACIFL